MSVEAVQDGRRGNMEKNGELGVCPPHGFKLRQSSLGSLKHAVMILDLSFKGKGSVPSALQTRGQRH